MIVIVPLIVENFSFKLSPQTTLLLWTGVCPSQCLLVFSSSESDPQLTTLTAVKFHHVCCCGQSLPTLLTCKNANPNSLRLWVVRNF